MALMDERMIFRDLPVPWPTKIVCVGLNYVDHAAESEMELPAEPLLFAKWPNALIGNREPIRLPSASSAVDFEAELAVVIGERLAKPVDPRRALDAIYGYTCLNDVSARDVQFADGQWTRGKSFNTFCPVGPTVVRAADVGDPQKLRIRSRLNGEVMQDASTAEMIFSVGEVVAFISQAVLLEAGDLIATGTPPGVGFARNPPVYLRDGDLIEVEIDQIGVLCNPVVGPSLGSE